MEFEEAKKSRTFTWEELSRLNQPGRVHVAHKGKVYDVSSFVSSHPGGAEQIMTASSHDITNIFELYHKPQTIKVLQEYYVGDLVDSEMPLYSNKSSKFYEVMKERVNTYMKDHNLDPKYDLKMFIAYFVFTSILWTCWYCTFWFNSYFAVKVLLAICWGASSGVVALTLGHDSSHYVITHKPWVWKTLKIVTGLSIGFCLYCWTYQHIYGHHKYTNVEGSDPDIVTTRKVNSVWRIKKQQPWIPRYLYQHMYMPLVYSLLTFKIKLQDFRTMYILKKGPVRMNPPSHWMWVEFFGTKIFHFFVRFYLPLSVMSWTGMVILNIIYELSFGFYLAFFTQLTHVNTKVAWPDPDSSNVIDTNKSWEELQVLTSTDYATDGWLWTILTGALNHQVAHHLFPGIIQSHYPHITPIVQATLKEYNIPYSYDKSILEAIYNHLVYLFKMGRKTH